MGFALLRGFFCDSRSRASKTCVPKLELGNELSEFRVAFTGGVFPFCGLFWYKLGDSVVLPMLAWGNVANIFVSLQNVWERKTLFWPLEKKSSWLLRLRFSRINYTSTHGRT